MSPAHRLDADPPARPTPNPVRAATLLALGVAVVLASAALLALAGLGSRWEWWSFRTGFTILRYATYGALGGALLSIVAAVLAVRRGAPRWPVTLGLVFALVGLAAAAVPYRWQRQARAVPPIHDITTDTETPPAFVAVVPLRSPDANPLAYGGDSIAAQQRAAYPDVQPLRLAIPPEAAFERARRAAASLGWTIVEASAAEGRLEATDRTRWFGFTDDVVVRVRPEAEGSRVDVRSVSRVGRSDVGMNAARIRRFLAAMRADE